MYRYAVMKTPGSAFYRYIYFNIAQAQALFILFIYQQLSKHRSDVLKYIKKIIRKVTGRRSRAWYIWWAFTLKLVLIEIWVWKHSQLDLFIIWNLFWLAFSSCEYYKIVLCISYVFVALFVDLISHALSYLNFTVYFIVCCYIKRVTQWLSLFVVYHICFSL